MLSEEELRDAVLLALANKQDMGMMGVLEITEWYIQNTCAMTGDGLYDGLDWLTKTSPKEVNFFC